MQQKLLAAVVAVSGVVSACEQERHEITNDPTIVGLAGRAANAGTSSAGGASGHAGSASSGGSASHANAGTGTGTGATTDTASTAPNPHWILRDRTGEPVEAMAYPYITQSMQALHFGKHADEAPECVGVEYLGGKRVGLTYRLDTGKVAVTCNGQALGTARADMAGFWFLDSTCSGTPYIDINLAGRYVIADRPYYAEKAEAVQATTYYSRQTGTCTAVTIAADDVRSPLMIAPVLPVPAPHDALPASPYTLALEY